MPQDDANEPSRRVGDVQDTQGVLDILADVEREGRLNTSLAPQSAADMARLVMADAPTTQRPTQRLTLSLSAEKSTARTGRQRRVGRASGRNMPGLGAQQPGAQHVPGPGAQHIPGPGTQRTRTARTFRSSMLSGGEKSSEKGGTGEKDTSGKDMARNAASEKDVSEKSDNEKLSHAPPSTAPKPGAHSVLSPSNSTSTTGKPVITARNLRTSVLTGGKRSQTLQLQPRTPGAHHVSPSIDTSISSSSSGYRARRELAKQRMSQNTEYKDQLPGAFGASASILEGNSKGNSKGNSIRERSRQTKFAAIRNSRTADKGGDKNANTAGMDEPVVPMVHAKAVAEPEPEPLAVASMPNKTLAGEDSVDAALGGGRNFGEETVCEEAPPSGPILDTAVRNATDVDTAEEEWEPKKAKYCRPFVVVAAICVVAVAIGVGVTLGTRKGGNNPADSPSMMTLEPSTTPPTMMPTSFRLQLESSPCVTANTTSDLTAASPRADMLRNYLQFSPEEDEQLSVQRKALCWMADVDPLQLDTMETPQRILQRYTMAVIFFSWVGDSSLMWLLGTTECQWEGVRCNDQQQVVHIILKELNLHGTIATEVGNLQNLERLELDSNNLFGPIPSSLWTIGSQVVLSLADNQLTGTIPPSIGDLSKLVAFFVSSNEFNGTIPDELYGIATLAFLRLDVNEYSGTISSRVGDLIKLEQLELSRNLFEGTIPSEIGRLTQLGLLSFGSNRFNSPIPSEIGLMTALELVSLLSTRLEGTLPTEMGNLSKLNFLALQNNIRLTGTVPSEIGQISLLGTFQATRTSLNGTMPQEVCNLKTEANLKVLAAPCIGDLQCSCCTACF